ncbi:hypothetical protein [Trichothermofontia sp.]
MTEQPRYQQDLRSAAEQDLLSALWQSDAQCYPWDLTPDLASRYFDPVEAEANLDAWEPTPAQSQGFYRHLDHLWLTVTAGATPAPTAASLLSRLRDRFAGKIPPDLLTTIAQRAQQTLQDTLATGIAPAQSRLDQLVYCVQALLPTWGEEDLQVLARPLAYAMRGVDQQSATDRLLETVRPIAWEALSEIEQARLSLTIADYALKTLAVTTITDDE